MKKLFKNLGVFCFLILLMFLSGCYKEIRREAIVDYKLLPDGFSEGSSFFISMSSNDNSVLAKNAIYALQKILIAKGFRVVSDKYLADYHLVFHYNMKSFQATVRLPMITGQSFTENQGQLVSSGYTNSVINYNGSIHGNINANVNGCGTIYSSHNDSINYRSTSHTTHMSYVPTEVIYFIKTILLEVFDIQKSMKIVWKGEASIVDQAPDLDASIALEFVSLFKHFGKTVKSKTVIETTNGFKKLITPKKIKKKHKKNKVKKNSKDY